MNNKSIDVIKNWGYVYASFLQAYNLKLDLKTLKELSWTEFTILLSNLTGENAITNIYSILQTDDKNLTSEQKRWKKELINNGW